MKKTPKCATKSWVLRPKCVPVVYYVTREFFFDDKTATSDGRLFRLSDSSCCQIRFFSHQNQGANQGRNLFTPRDERGREEEEMENSSVLRYSTAQVKSNGHPPNAASPKNMLLVRTFELRSSSLQFQQSVALFRLKRQS